MHILQQLRRSVGRSLRTLVTVIAVLVVIIPSAAWAAHQFGDVPSSNVFHGDIDWMSDNGVTKGCNPPANDQYCPDGLVTREQMAAFMHRLETEGVFAPTDHEHVALFDTATDRTGVTHTNLTYANLSGASATVKVPAGHEAIIVARFSAESACYGVTGWCSVRLLVNGTEMHPASSLDYRFDSSESNSANSNYTEGHAMERVSGTLSSGTYTVTVHVATVTSFPPLNFRLDDWTLVAEAKLTS